MIQSVAAVAAELQEIIMYHSFYLHQAFDALDTVRDQEKDAVLAPAEFNIKAL